MRITGILCIVAFIFSCKNFVEPEPVIESVTITPSDTTVYVSDTLQFEVYVQGTGDFDSSVAWQVNSSTGGNTTYGTITEMGLYTTPSTVPLDSFVIVHAISAADPNMLDSAFITIRSDTTVTLEIISVTVAPPEVTLTTGENVQFEAMVEGTGAFDSTVMWQVNNTVGGNEIYGTITRSGFYTTPVTMPPGSLAVVKAVSTVVPEKYGSSIVHIRAQEPDWTVTSVTIAPRDTTVRVSEVFQFAVAVSGTGSFDPSVTWYVNGAEGGTSIYGTITTSGLYTAPDNVPPELVVIVWAVSVADSAKYDSTVVELFSIDSVNVSPQPDSIFVGYQEQFTAAVYGTGSNVTTDVTWLVNDLVGGNERYGYIDQGGLYTAPDTVPLLLDEPRILDPHYPTRWIWRQDTVVVTVKSVADPQNQDSASFFISSGILAMGIIPTIIEAVPNDTIQFTPIFYGTPVNTSVQWLVHDALFGHQPIEGGNEELGVISTDGLYIAPVTWPPVYDVWIGVRSAVDRNRYAWGGVGFWSRP